MRLRVKPKRIISLALAGCMAVSMVPASAVTAFAAEGIGVPSITAPAEEEGESQAKSVTVTVSEAGKLEEEVKKIAEEEGIGLSDITELTVIGGPLNAADLEFLSGIHVEGDITSASASVHPLKDADTYLSNLKKVNLKKATLADDTIPARSFCQNKTIEIFVLPDTLKVIEPFALSWMDAVKYIGTDENGTAGGDVCFPDSLTTIDDSAFWHDKGLTGNLILPTRDHFNMGCGVFGETNVKGELTFGNNMVWLKSVKDMPHQQKFSKAQISKVSYDNTITVVPKEDFYDCPLTSIKLSESIKVIEEGAFVHPVDSTTIQKFEEPLIIPANVEKIGKRAFARAGEIENVIVENPDIVLEDECFKGLSTDTVGTKIYLSSLPTNVSKIYGTDGNTLVLNTAGGTIDTAKGVDPDTGLYTPVKSDGSRFDGWYADVADETTRVTKTNPAAAGKTYTAKWTSNPSVLTTDIGQKTFVVGEPVEFTFSTVANDDKGTMVVGTSNFSDADAIEKLEYYEVNDSKWYELKGDFGVSTGFPMTDATSKFRVTFKKAGKYTFIASMKKADGDTVLCSTEVGFSVGTMASNATVTDEGGTSMTSYKAGEPVRVTLNAEPNDPEAFKENTLTLTYGDEVEKVELKGNELDGKEYKISALLAMMAPDNAQITVQALDAGKTITIPLDVTYKTNGKHSFGMTVTNAAGTTVCEQNKEITISDDEPMPVGSHTLTVKGGTVKVNGAKADLEKGTAVIPEGATVEVTFDKDAFADSGLKFGHWDIEGLKDPNAYQDKESFTFKMPANDVKLTAMTQDASIDDGPDVLGTAAVITTAAVGGAVLAWQGYQIGTELYLTYLLPAGAAIPANTAELAKLVWTDAGKPAPAAVLPEDAAEEQQAMAWAAESGLISADESADASVSKMDVIKTWKKAQEMKG